MYLDLDPTIQNIISKCHELHCEKQREEKQERRMVFYVHDWGSHMCVNNEIDNDERAKGDPIRSTKLTLRQRQSKQKNKFANKVGPFRVLELINSTPTHFDFAIGFPTRAILDHPSKPCFLEAKGSIKFCIKNSLTLSSF